MTAIKEARTRLGLTAQQAAEKAAVAYKTWLRIEAGRPVRLSSWHGVDKVFGLAPGTALRAVMNDGDLDAVLRKGVERRHGIDDVMATINAETIPDLIDHASRRLRQALAVLMQGHADELAEVRAENARLRAALGGGAAAAYAAASSEPEAQTVAGAQVSPVQTTIGDMIDQVRLLIRGQSPKCGCGRWFQLCPACDVARCYGCNPFGTFDCDASVETGQRTAS